MTLLFFDIDGTLLRVNRGVHRAVAQAVENVTGKALSTGGVSFSGRTDLEIFRDVLVKSGVSNPDGLLDDVIARYAEVAQDTIQPDHVEALPGVPALLSQLGSRDDVFLGLVTGNVKAVAYHKLRHAGLADYFPVGAFGSDHADRAELPPIALRRASQHVGQPVSPEQSIIVGDTQHDIHCAQAAGIRSVAVCTGRFSRPELAAHTPDVLLNNLSDERRFVEQILEI